MTLDVRNPMAPNSPDLDALILDKGAHGYRDRGVCLMEAVAWFANEPHSDKPACASRVLGSYGIGINDRMPDDQRQRLKPFIERLVGSAGDRALEERRAWFLRDRTCRVIWPARIELLGHNDQATRLRNALAITNRASADLFRVLAKEVRAELWRRREASYAAAYADAAAAYAADAAAAYAADAYAAAAAYDADAAAADAAYAADHLEAVRLGIANAYQLDAFDPWGPALVTFDLALAID